MLERLRLWAGKPFNLSAAESLSQYNAFDSLTSEIGQPKVRKLIKDECVIEQLVMVVEVGGVGETSIVPNN